MSRQSSVAGVIYLRAQQVIWGDQVFWGDQVIWGDGLIGGDSASAQSQFDEAMTEGE